MRLPSKDSATWRALVTSIEGSAVFLLGLFSLPEVKDYLIQQRPEILPVFPIILGLLNFIRNFFRSSVKNY